jgi:hypothetical protein
LYDFNNETAGDGDDADMVMTERSFTKQNNFDTHQNMVIGK